MDRFTRSLQSATSTSSTSEAARFSAANLQSAEPPTCHPRPAESHRDASTPEQLTHPRFAEARLVEALGDSPAVLLQGPRQCGKTTLARKVGEARGYGYVTFDDPTVLEVATKDPVGIVGELPERVVIDEVQRAPGIFTSLKPAIDRGRRAGRFLLTGSSNVMLLPMLSDSLAGRIAIVRLWPLAQTEVAGKDNGFIERLFEGGFKVRSYERLGSELAARVVAGGFPAALVRESSRRRRAWFADYVETLVHRDVRDMARVSSLDTLSRLVTAIAGQTARTLDVNDLASPFEVSRPTIQSYVALLERILLVDRVPAWHSNELARLVKAPKLHVGDTGLACAVLSRDAETLRRDGKLFGQMLETFAFQELARQATWSDGDVRFFHYRDRDGAEVDIVLERGVEQIVGIEVKASSTVTSSDFHGLRRLQRATGERFARGVVLYDGETSLPFREGMRALPIRMLWE